MNVKEVKTLISNGNLKAAINLTLEYSEKTTNRFYNELINLSRSYHEYHEKYRLGIGKDDNTINHITYTLIEILDSIDTEMLRNSHNIQVEISQDTKLILDTKNIDSPSKRKLQLKEAIKKIDVWDNRDKVSEVDFEELTNIRVNTFNFYFCFSQEKNNESYRSTDWQVFLKTLKLASTEIKGGIFVYITVGLIDLNIYEKANEINNNNQTVLIIDYEDWSCLSKYSITLPVFLNYLVKFNRNYGVCKFYKVKEQLDNISRKINTESRINKFVKKQSDIFHLRFKHDFHEQIYVSREIDRKFISVINKVKPSKLKHIYDKNLETSEINEQICIVRDVSGAGKTTFAVNSSLYSDTYFGVGITADEVGIDKIFHSFINSLGNHFGLEDIIFCDKPIVFIIDSLDEASQGIEKKRKELIALIRYLNHLNSEARKYGLYSFPISLVFTVRETYWRDWENIFEGRAKITLKKVISTFQDNTFNKAISKYSKAYNYKFFISKLTKEQREILAIPINLQIFSEANRGKGDIRIESIWKDNVIDLYFERKQRDILKRNVSEITPKKFLILLSAVAFYTVEKGQNLFNRKEIYTIINKSFDSLLIYIDEIINVLISERILINDIKAHNSFRFKHSRFIEYLIAYFAVWMTYIRCDIKHLQSLTETALKSGLVSMFRVHDDITYICYNRFQSTKNLINDYYSSSKSFLSKKLTSLRGGLANNRDTKIKDIELLLRKNSSHKGEIAWNAYFVFISKRNNKNINPDDVLVSFSSAWNTNKDRFDRWKLIIKLPNCGLLTHEKVFPIIFASKNYKEWQVYLGLIYKNYKQDTFKELWLQNKGERIIHERLQEFSDTSWKNVNKLLQAILNNEEITLGDFDADHFDE